MMMKKALRILIAAALIGGAACAHAFNLPAPAALLGPLAPEAPLTAINAEPELLLLFAIDTAALRNEIRAEKGGKDLSPMEMEARVEARLLAGNRYSIFGALGQRLQALGITSYGTRENAPPKPAQSPSARRKPMCPPWSKPLKKRLLSPRRSSSSRPSRPRKAEATPKMMSISPLR